jgi:hypothetical protein
MQPARPNRSIPTVLILFGLLGVYAYQHAESGIWGFAGVLLAAIGLEGIGGPDGKIGDVDIYTAGATLIGIGLVVLPVGSWSFVEQCNVVDLHGT